MFGLPGGLGALAALAVGVFVLYVLVIAILLPFFVFRIRNEMIELNKNVASLLKHQSDANAKIVTAIEGRSRSVSSGGMSITA